MEWNEKLIEWLSLLGVGHYFGVTGGGVIQIAKYLNESNSKQDSPSFEFISEYAAGFAPLGYYLATGKVAACLVTTGAAEKLAIIGASDARFMNIPAVYLFALSGEANEFSYPIQDISANGMNIIEQIQAEFNDQVFVIDSSTSIADVMTGIARTIQKSQPVIVMFHPEVLCNEATGLEWKLTIEEPQIQQEKLDAMIEQLSRKSLDGRVLVMTNTEAAVSDVTPLLFKEFVERLSANVIYTVNGDNIATETEKYNLGHIMLGGNSAAIDAWQDLCPNDILILLGLDVGEYALNQEKLPQCQIYCLTQFYHAYGQKEGSYKHLAQSDYTEIKGDLAKSIEYILQKTEDVTIAEGPHFENSTDDYSLKPTSAHFVDIVSFYNRLNDLWQENSIVFEDICIAYRDRQAILKNPNKQVKIFTSNHGSAMGSAFGMAFGAAIADKNNKIFAFSGDGCFRLYAGSLAEAAQLNLTLFIMNNNQLSLIYDGCKHILGDNAEYEYHDTLGKIDFCGVAQAFGWRAIRLIPDLSNLDEVMQLSYDSSPQSLLVDVAIDHEQVIGKNFRYANITPSSNL